MINLPGVMGGLKALDRSIAFVSPVQPKPAAGQIGKETAALLRISSRIRFRSASLAAGLSRYGSSLNAARGGEVFNRLVVYSNHANSSTLYNFVQFGERQF